MDNPAFRGADAKFRQLQLMIRDGQGETDAADVVREEAADFWDQLSPADQARVRRLSAELDMICGDEVPQADPARTDAVRRANKARRQEKNVSQRDVDRRTRLTFARLIEAGAWDNLLDAIRLRPTLLTSWETAMTRGQAYMHMGQVETALTFMDYAASVCPAGQRDKVAIFRVHVLDRAGRGADAVELALTLIRTTNVNVAAFINACHYVVWATDAEPSDRDEAEQRARHLLAVMRADPRRGDVVAAASKVLAEFAIHAGREDDARQLMQQSYDAVSSVDTTIGLAHLLFDADRSRAVGLLRSVEDKGNPWPAYFLAIALVQAADYQGALAHANKWLDRVHNPRIVAMLLQTRADARLKLGDDPATVLPDLERAARLAGGTDDGPMLRANLQRTLDEVRDMDTTLSRPTSLVGGSLTTKRDAGSFADRSAMLYDFHASTLRASPVFAGARRPRHTGPLAGTPLPSAHAHRRRRR